MMISRRGLPYLALATGLTLSVAASSSPRFHLSHEEKGKQKLMSLEAITAELKPVEEAQRLTVHKFSNFFSEEDIRTVLAFQAAHRQTLVLLLALHC